MIFILAPVPMIASSVGVEILNHRELLFSNDNCKITNTCDLKRVKYVVEDYKVAIEDGHNYGTRFFAEYETKSVKNLEKYVFVQLIKGCDFSSRIQTSQVAVELDFSYPRGYGEQFKFSDWVIDSYGHDPAYSSIPGKSRFFGYRWNTVPGSFSTNTEKFYGEEKPKNPVMYIVDHPGTAFYMNGIAKNISLKFKTCVYKTKDVPSDVNPNETNFAKPFSCFEWNSSFVYNHKVGEFESPAQIVPACQ